MFLQMWSDGISRDPLACMQLGLCMMMDKPIHLAVPYGSEIPSNMRRIARSIEYYNPNDKNDVDRVALVISKKTKGKK